MKKFIIIAVCLFIFFFLGSWWTDKNTLYSKNTWVKPFFSTYISSNGQIALKKQRNLYVLPTNLGKFFMLAEAFFRIEGNVYNPEKPFHGTEQEIIKQIHQERFNPQQAYTITGGHFAELYVRNFGIFYAAMLDSRIPTSQADWVLRQRVTLQRVATDLELLKQAGKKYTTFSPITGDTFVGTNFNAPPSDSLFSILYTLLAATDDTFIPQTLPTIHTASAYPLQTQQAEHQLIIKYIPILSSAISNYFNENIDASTGIIKKNIFLSSARDSIKQESSFYDNVIAWATAKNSEKLGIPFFCPLLYKKNIVCDLEKWKKIIMAAFWDDKDGLFLDDLSRESIKNHTFTGEEFIVVSAGFFDLSNSDDKNKLYRMIKYVKKNNLDKPLPLFYAKSDQPEKY